MKTNKTNRTRISAADRHRIRQLALEGMPLRYIAADLGRNGSNFYKIVQDLPNRRESIKEWSSCWQSIRQNHVLLELHREIMLQ